MYGFVFTTAFTTHNPPLCAFSNLNLKCYWWSLTLDLFSVRTLIYISSSLAMHMRGMSVLHCKTRGIWLFVVLCKHIYVRAKFMSTDNLYAKYKWLMCAYLYIKLHIYTNINTSQSLHLRALSLFRDKNFMCAVRKRKDG